MASGRLLILGNLLGKILPVALQQGGNIVFQNIHLSPDLPGLPGLESTDAKVGVDTANHTLEEFLVGLPDEGEDQFVVGRKTANEPVAGEHPC